MLVWSEEKAFCDQIHCFFDQGEPFYGNLVQLLQNRKATQQSPLILKIKRRTETDSREVPALQMADLFAWAHNHRSDGESRPWCEKLLRLPYRFDHLDENNLHLVHEVNRDAWISWKMPKRKRTK
ncbi:MAG TPA: hypothetical protein VFE06_03520 [Acidobacteriaceae bacterium]|nr:hypothetical protein [Acidobacteriaceae bacterium]